MRVLMVDLWNCILFMDGCLQSLLNSKTPRALNGDFAKAREISNENFSVVRGHVVEKSPGNDMESYISHAIEKCMLLFSEPFL